MPETIPCGYTAGSFAKNCWSFITSAGSLRCPAPMLCERSGAHVPVPVLAPSTMPCTSDTDVEALIGVRIGRNLSAIIRSPVTMASFVYTPGVEVAA